LPHQEQIHADKLDVSISRLRAGIGLHYGTEITPYTDLESWH